jgi:hypothetical protein
MTDDVKYCECGCGEELDFTKGRKTKRFKKGHAIRVNNKAAAARRGQTPWNKDKPRSEKTKKKISQSQRETYESGNRKEYIKTEEHKAKLIEAAKRPKSAEQIKKMLETRSRKTSEEKREWRDKISETLKERYANGEIQSSFYIDGRWKSDPESHYNLYGGCFTPELKKEIRDRDNWTSVLCGERGMVVHHIDEDKLNNTPGNLITLCRADHAKHHHANEDVKSQNTALFLESIRNKIISD